MENFLNMEKNDKFNNKVRDLNNNGQHGCQVSEDNW